MRITFLGASHGVPEAHRKCSCAMITLGAGQDAVRYFVDMGVMAIDWMRTAGIPVSSARAIFITHMHGDHTNGLPHFVDLCSWYFKDANPTVFLPEEEAIPALSGWLAANGTSLREEIRCEITHDGVIYDDGRLTVTAFRTRHCRTSYAYLVEAEGKRVLFTGDLSHKGPADDFPRATLADGLDLAICESAHFPATEYAPLFAENPPRHVVINHYQPRLYPSICALAEALAPTPVDAATDDWNIAL